MFIPLLSCTDHELERQLRLMVEMHKYFQQTNPCQHQSPNSELCNAETSSYDDCGSEAPSNEAGPDDWDHVSADGDL